MPILIDLNGILDVMQKREPHYRASLDVLNRILALGDFEDAVVASAAKACGYQRIITRHVADFKGAPIVAITPEEFLASRSV